MYNLLAETFVTFLELHFRTFFSLSNEIFVICRCIIPMYVDIMTAEKLSLMQPANMELIYWSVGSYSRRGGYDKGVEVGNRYQKQLKSGVSVSVNNDLEQP